MEVQETNTHSGAPGVLLQLYQVCFIHPTELAADGEWKKSPRCGALHQTNNLKQC